jgi:hypothetical protein
LVGGVEALASVVSGAPAEASIPVLPFSAIDHERTSPCPECGSYVQFTLI